MEPLLYRQNRKKCWIRIFWRITGYNKFCYSLVLISLLFCVFFMINTRDILIKSSIKPFIIRNVAKVNYPVIKNNETETIYILLWTDEESTPFVYFGRGRAVFLQKNCTWTNCYVTSDRNYLGYYTEFDVIAFHGPTIMSLYHLRDLPRRRSLHQKYVYANIEASANYEINSDVWNRFFNWTWTYKLNSDAVWGYLLVRNASNDIIGPAVDIPWMKLEEMAPIEEDFKKEIGNKTKAAAWFSSNCFTTSHREIYVKEIQKELEKYKLHIDIYGECGTHICHRNDMEKCLQLLGQNYFFYFAFENAFSQDYVTEKIVYALNHNTVPVVYGGANYTRFMPEGIYLDAVKLGPKKLAKRMHDLMHNTTEYQDFFRWRKHYSFHFRNEVPETDDYCNFCAMLNDQELVKTTTVYEDFSRWWSEGNVQPPVMYLETTVDANIQGK